MTVERRIRGRSSMFHLFLTPFLCGSCGPGIRYAISTSSSTSSWDGTRTQALLEHNVFLVWRWLRLRGSVRPSTTGTHRFETSIEAYGVSATAWLGADSQFENSASDYQRGATSYLYYIYADYRHRFQERSSDNRNFLAMWLSIQVIRSSSMVTLMSSYADDCYQDGCRETAYSRNFSCLPSPSIS
jgi:hypothetical protein